MSDNVDLTRVEELLGDLAKSIQAQPEVDSTVEAIAKGADALVAKTQESHDVLSKSLEALSALVGDLSSKVDALSALVTDKIEKSITELASQPQPRAVTAVPELAPNDAPAAAAVITREQVISKALTELKTAEGERKLQLLNAVAKLETNYAPSEVAAALKFN